MVILVLDLGLLTPLSFCCPLTGSAKVYSLPVLPVVLFTTQTFNRYRRIPYTKTTWKNIEWGRVLLSIFQKKQHYKYPQLWEHQTEIKIKHDIKPYLNTLWNVGVFRSFFRDVTLAFPLNALVQSSPVKTYDPRSVVHHYFPKVQARSDTLTSLHFFPVPIST